MGAQNPTPTKEHRLYVSSFQSVPQWSHDVDVMSGRFRNPRRSTTGASRRWASSRSTKRSSAGGARSGRVGSRIRGRCWNGFVTTPGWLQELVSDVSEGLSRETVRWADGTRSWLELGMDLRFGHFSSAGFQDGLQVG